MLAVIKEVLPPERWKAEPELLLTMQQRGVVTATQHHFTQFYQRYRLLDALMNGAGAEAKGFQCIFVNRSRYRGMPAVRHYYKLPSPKARLLYVSPKEQPEMREAPLRRQNLIDSSLIENYMEYSVPPPPAAAPVPSVLSVSPRAPPPKNPAKVRRTRSVSPRLSATPAGSASKFGDRQVCAAAAPLFSHLSPNQPLHVTHPTAPASMGL